ncbi:Fmt Methionyl-tRNA formyltransferase [Candidatus Nanopelagicaceae bacterium]
MVGDDSAYSTDCVQVILEHDLPLVAIGGEGAAQIANRLNLKEKFPGLLISCNKRPWEDLDFYQKTSGPNLLGLSLGLGEIIPEQFLASRFCVNTHPSALPFNRGSHQSFWAIMDETAGGGTLHQMTAGVDEGAILYQETFPIPSWMTSEELQSRQLRSCINLLRVNLKRIFSGDYELMAQEGGTSHLKREIKNETTLKENSSIQIAQLLKLCRATCNKGNGFWIETEAGEFHIQLNGMEFHPNSN